MAQTYTNRQFSQTTTLRLAMIRNINLNIETTYQLLDAFAKSEPTAHQVVEQWKQDASLLYRFGTWQLALALKWSQSNGTGIAKAETFGMMGKVVKELKVGEQKWRVSLYAYNLLDKRAYTTNLETDLLRGTTAIAAVPRFAYLQLDMNF